MTSEKKTTYRRKPKPKSDKPPCHRSHFVAEDDVLFGDDDLAVPVLFPIGEGEKLERASQLFGLSTKTIDRKAKQYRIYQQSAKGATKFVFLPALSAIINRDWAPFRMMQRGKFDHDRVRDHAHIVQQREVAFKEAELAKTRKEQERKAKRERSPSMRLVTGGAK